MHIVYRLTDNGMRFTLPFTNDISHGNSISVAKQLISTNQKTVKPFCFYVCFKSNSKLVCLSCYISIEFLLCFTTHSMSSLFSTKMYATAHVVVVITSNTSKSMRKYASDKEFKENCDASKIIRIR